MRFLQNRGCKDSAELTKYAIAKPRDCPVSNRFVIGSNDLFDKPDTAKLKNEKVLNRIGVASGTHPLRPHCSDGYSALRGDAEENLILTQARAMVVREYLVEHFTIDERRIKRMGTGEDSTRDARVEILLYPVSLKLLKSTTGPDILLS